MIDKAKTFRMTDSVLHRFVQIVQEAFLTGTDVSDHLRMVEMCPDATDPSRLVLTEEYVDMVRKQHETMLKFVETQKAAQKTVASDSVDTQVEKASSIILNSWDKQG